MRRPRSDLRIDSVGGQFRVTDPFGIRPTRVLSELEHAIFAALARGASFGAIRSLARARGFSLARGELDAFVDELGHAGLLAGEDADRDRAEAVRRAVVDGTLVVSGRADVGELCAALLADARDANRRELGDDVADLRVEGMLSPHGNLELTGAVAARGYALLAADRWPDVFVIIGTSHYGGPPTILLRDVHTPLGRLRCHRAFADALRTRSMLPLVADAPELVAEHSWRQDLPLLQTVGRELGRVPRVVAILIGGATHDQARALARAIRGVAFERAEHACVIASGDLDHAGAGYGWSPPGVTARASVDSVVTATLAHERPLLAAIARRDVDAFARGVAATSFCARAQVSALLEHATCEGRVLAHAAVVGGVPYTRPIKRRWTGGDALFAAGSVVFARGMPTARARGRIRACNDLIVRPERDRVVMLHRCTLDSHAIPPAGWPIVEALWRGVDRVSDAGAAAGDASADEVGAFVGELASQRVIHAPEAPRVPPEHARAPVIRADDLRGLPVDVKPRRGVTVRISSASSGRAPIRTMVEDSVRDARSLVEILVQPAAVRGRCVHINRPTNLSLAPPRRGWPNAREVIGDLEITPGPNPSAVEPAVWSRTLERIVHYDPVQLEGDPAYLAALAYACLARRVVLPRLRYVFVGHGYAWAVHRAAIRAAFGVEPIVRFHASELGSIAIACDLGGLHLLDHHVYYEVVDGELVATTLDTKIRPLVRYAIGDRVRVVAPACACGKPFRVIEYLGRTGEPFSYPELDAALGAPSGMQLFQLVVRARDAVLSVTPADARVLADLAAPVARLEALLGRRVRTRFVDTLPVPEGGKLLALKCR